MTGVQTCALPISCAKLISTEDFNIDNGYQFDITTLSFSDNNCYIFAVSNGAQVRILASKLKYAVETSKHLLENADI